MTESAWLKSRDGYAMLERVADYLTDRKWTILADIDRVTSNYPRVRQVVHRAMRAYGIRAKPKILAHSLREQLGNPFRPYPFDPRWRTETVAALASAIEAERAFDRMPILADALEEAGCDWPELLAHCRYHSSHAPGCWVLDLILDREPELFALPPLVPTPRRMQLGPFTPPPEGMA